MTGHLPLGMLFNPSTGYEPAGALYLDGSADYLSWTPSSAGSKTDFTISFWIKLIDTDLSSTSYILSAGDGTGNEEFAVAWLDSEILRIFSVSSGSYQNFDYRTSQVFRDPTAWQNWVISFDHNNGTAGDRIRLWINGSEVADADFGTSTDPVDGETAYWTDAVAHNIGRTVQGSNYAPMYLAEFINLDGTSVTAPSDFGEYNSTTGIWVPKDPSTISSFGTNGFWLGFADGSNIGKDTAGGSVKQDISGATATNPGGGLHNFSGSGVLDDDTGQDGFYLSGDEASQTVDVDLGSGNSLAVTAAGWIVENNGGNNQAAVWSIFYSDNGSDWTDTSQNLTVTDDGSSMSEQRTLITGQTAHRYWRLSIDSTTANNNGWYSGLRLYTGGSSRFANDFTPSSMGANNIAGDGPANSTDKEIIFYPALEESGGYDNSGTMALSNNNLTGTPNNNNEHTRYLNIPINKADTTKYYFEVSCGSGNDFGAMFVNNEVTRTSTGRANLNTWTGAIESTTELRWWEENGNSGLGYKPTIQTYDYSNDRLCFAIDGNNDKIWVGHYDNSAGSTTWANNNTGSPGMDADPTDASDAGTLSFDFTTTTGNMYIALYQSNGSGRAATMHLTSSSWSGTAPSGYSAITKTVTGVGNAATLNPLIFNGTISEGNLKHTADSSGYINASVGTVSASSGKFYHEIDMVSSIDSTTTFGVVDVGDLAATRMDQNSSHYVGHANGGGWAYKPTPKKWTNTTQEDYGVSVTDGDTLQVYTDLDNGKLYFGKNGTLMESANLTNGTGYAYDTLSGQLVPAFGIYQTDVIKVRFSPDDWQYTPAHSDYKAWSTQNIPEPSITDPSKYFQTQIWTGNATARSITFDGLSDMQPDLVWIKERNDTQNHTMFDSLRLDGSNIPMGLTVNAHAAETTSDATALTAFNADGFSLGDNSTGTNATNRSGSKTYVAWAWKAGGSPSTVTDGMTQISDASVNSNISRSVNTTAKCSIFTYTGTGNASKIQHGMGVKPDTFWIKCRDTTQGFHVWHKDLDTTNQGYIILNSSQKYETFADLRIWGSNSLPDATHVMVGTHAGTNNSGDDFVGYAFAGVAGFSKFDIYEGNGTTDNAFINLGFKPSLFICKNMDSGVDGTGSATNWLIFDSIRNPYNDGSANFLQANETAVESQFNVDFLSNGVKIREDNQSLGASNTYIYMAWAETPFPLNNRAR